MISGVRLSGDPFGIHSGVPGILQFRGVQGGAVMVSKLFVSARRAGYSALAAYRVAKTVLAFEARDDVRIVMAEECDSYFDVYGDPEGYLDVNGRRHSAADEHKETEDLIERLGCWIVSSEARDAQTGEWETVDSIGMNTGYENPADWRENWYVPDLMQSALDYAENKFIGV